MQVWELAGAALLGAVAAAVGTPAGVSGGLLLLPVLLSGYGLTGTVAGATNLVFNIVSTPGGIARHLANGHVDRPLTRLLCGAAVPGAVAGAAVNVLLLGDTRAFRLLVAALLVTVAASLLLPRPGRTRPGSAAPMASPNGSALTGSAAPKATPTGSAAPKATPTGGSRPGAVRELGRRLRVILLVTGLLSGVVGGFYGLGGAVLAAPAALALTGWPVSRVSGAALVTTLSVSVTGLLAYLVMDLVGLTSVQTPHWPLGLALGGGGLVGGYLAARLARRLPDRLLRTSLAGLVALAAVRLASG